MYHARILDFGFGNACQAYIYRHSNVAAIKPNGMVTSLVIFIVTMATAVSLTLGCKYAEQHCFHLPLDVVNLILMKNSWTIVLIALVVIVILQSRVVKHKVGSAIAAINAIATLYTNHS